MKYVGSKSRIAKYIVPIIQGYINTPLCRGYIEPFVGGANVIDKIKCKRKWGFDSNPYLIALLLMARDRPQVIPQTISKQEYLLAKEKTGEYAPWFVGLCGFCASYNGKWFGGYANGVKTKSGTIRNYTDEAIRNLKKQCPNLKGCEFINSDFRGIYEGIEGYVIYCDPPYRGTTNYSQEAFPYEEFYDWCRKMSVSNVVLVSEYWMPEDFHCIWEGSLCCSLDKNSRKNKVEKLFICTDWEEN